MKTPDAAYKDNKNNFHEHNSGNRSSNTGVQAIVDEFVKTEN
jgi:hypothetical protein